MFLVMDSFIAEDPSAVVAIEVGFEAATSSAYAKRLLANLNALRRHEVAGSMPMRPTASART